MSVLASYARDPHRDHRVLGAVLHEHRHIAARPPSRCRCGRGRVRTGSSPARRSGRSDAARSATLSATPAPWENPPKTASARAKPSSAHCSSTKPSTRSTASANAVGVDAGLGDREPGEARRSRRRVRRPGHDRGEAALGIEVGQQSAEILLVGAVAVQQDEEAVGGASAHHGVGQRHRTLSQRDDAVPGIVGSGIHPVRKGSPCDSASTSATRTGARGSPAP